MSKHRSLLASIVWFERYACWAVGSSVKHDIDKVRSNGATNVLRPEEHVWRRSWKRKTGANLPAELRFHDLRHDFGTKLLRMTRNLKLTQQALGHARIETTMRYAHVLDEEVLAGMKAASTARQTARTLREQGAWT